MDAALLTGRWPRLTALVSDNADDSRCDEAALIARCRAGDEAAYEILLRRYRERVLNLAYQLLRQPQDAEDVAQEAFTRAFTSLHRFRGDAEFFTWLYRITLNLCAQRRRRRRPAPMEDVEASSASVQAEVEAKLGVEYALDQLSPPLRVVLILREMHDLSYEEIAAVLHLPVGTVRSRLNAARRKFRAVWEAMA